MWKQLSCIASDHEPPLVSEELNSVETLYLLHIGWIVDLGFRRT